MDDSTTPLPPAGWYADPEGGSSARFWDGAAWAAPSAPVTTPAAASPTASAATQTTVAMTASESNNWHIRLIALLPLLMLPGILIFDVSTLVPMITDPSIQGQLAMYLDPGYLLMLAGSWIAYLASIPLAYFDYKYLTERGIIRPFHWAFVIIGGYVYVIGRAIVVRNRTGTGLFPIWIASAVQVALTIALIVLFVNMTTTIVDAIFLYL